jgi:uncharacterized protein (DUF433 family)
MRNEQQELLDRITIIPGLMSGNPAIRGMRFPVGDILEMLSGGMSHAEILQQHIVLEDKNILAALHMHH